MLVSVFDVDDGTGAFYFVQVSQRVYDYRLINRARPGRNEEFTFEQDCLHNRNLSQLPVDLFNGTGSTPSR